ncbi:Uu.00g025520.m01.CDS01 [Anthostomella pinea]|uniref:Uu.00g025520.m01.CDS01 n=1 Tax=Anthostomella pinea TaxID=933095 RepID=A0AAI8V7B7_9PEZI|nr:Uu.00g025520.m01.CDS01 [Anthostomella pinea]
MLPRPSLSVQLPSLYDGTKLECRVYHPACLNDPSVSLAAAPWPRHAAVVAHPYAPLGGCFDDPVVDVVASALLQLSFVVATFNFRTSTSNRGTSSSGGRTSWTSRPERADYMSAAAFLAYYVHYLDPPQASAPRANQTGPGPTMLLAGYSYGAMITIKLPPFDAVMSYLSTPVVGTTAADIRLRAQHLAEQQNALFAMPVSPRKSLGMRTGGREDTLPRKSYDRPRERARDGEERIRNGVLDLLQRTKLIRQKQKVPALSGDQETEAVEGQQTHDCLARVEDLVGFRSAYLAVSPPIGLVTSLATMSFSNPFASWSRRSSGRSRNGGDEGAAEQAAAEGKLTTNPTLVIYGSQDGFLTPRKVREWTAQLSRTEGSLFQHVEVSGAGHFWDEEGVVAKLTGAIASFASGLIGEQKVR